MKEIKFIKDHPMGFKKDQVITVNKFDYKLFIERGYAEEKKVIKSRKTKELK